MLEFLQEHWMSLLGGLVVVLACLGLGYYLLTKKKADVDEDDDEDEKDVVEIFYFYTTWCPMCKTAKPEWDAFKGKYQNKEYKGYTLIFTEVDCDRDEAVARKYNIVGYPTIKLVKGNKITEYDAVPKAETLDQFLESCID
jgi:thiol-disulfide isomerase/thioredoxin